jgi:hypothetical protein
LEEGMLNNFVGGYAGSGTRVIQMMLERAGVWVGAEKLLKASYDAHYTQPWYSRPIDIRERPTTLLENFISSFEDWREANQEWSNKNGESMWCIPFLRSLFPESTYILVVRNGLDNALTSVPFSEMYLNIIFPGNENLSFFDSRIKFWSEVNELAIREGKQHFGDKFLIVRLEDIINSPVQEGQKIFDHLGLKFNESYVDFVSPQPSVGKHREECLVRDVQYDPEIHLNSLKEIGMKTLEKLGY